MLQYHLRALTQEGVLRREEQAGGFRGQWRHLYFVVEPADGERVRGEPLVVPVEASTDAAEAIA
jgi:hypothetical protein